MARKYFPWTLNNYKEEEEFCSEMFFPHQIGISSENPAVYLEIIQFHLHRYNATFIYFSIQVSFQDFGVLLHGYCSLKAM